jgi:hypothetical protein
VGSFIFWRVYDGKKQFYGTHEWVMARVIVAVTPGKRPAATLYCEKEYLGEIIILGPHNILVKTRDGRRDRFRSIETCARFCISPMSENIEVEWRTK